MGIFEKLTGCGLITGSFVLIWVEHWLAHIALTVWMILLLLIIGGAMVETNDKKKSKRKKSKITKTKKK